MKTKFYVQFISNGCETELVYKAKNKEEALAKFQKDMIRNPNISGISVSKEATLTCKKEALFIQTSTVSRNRTTKNSARALIG